MKCRLIRDILKHFNGNHEEAVKRILNLPAPKSEAGNLDAYLDILTETLFSGLFPSGRFHCPYLTPLA